MYFVLRRFFFFSLNLLGIRLYKFIGHLGTLIFYLRTLFFNVCPMIHLWDIKSVGQNFNLGVSDICGSETALKNNIQVREENTVCGNLFKMFVIYVCV